MKLPLLHFIERTRLWLRKDMGIATIVAILWQATLTVLGAFFDATLDPIFQKGHHPAVNSLLLHTRNWDSGWYDAVIRGAYADPHSASAVFYPLFPATIAFLHAITFGLVGNLVLGLLLNTVCLAIAIYALKKISEFFLPKKFAWWPVILFILSPAAIFMHFFYTEALFCSIAFMAYLFALQRKWLFMGIALGLLTATRLPSILFVGLCALEFMRAYEWNLKKIFNRNLLYFLIAPIGFVAYGFYLLTVRGDFFGMFHAYQTHAWPYQIFNPNIFDLYDKVITQIVTVLTSPKGFDHTVVNYLLPFIGLIILLISSVYLFIRARKHIGVPLGIFGIVSIVFFSLNSNLISVDRYLLPCFTIYLAIAVFATKQTYRHYLLYVVGYGSVLLQGYLLILFVNNYFAG